MKTCMYVASSPALTVTNIGEYWFQVDEVERSVDYIFENRAREAATKLVSRAGITRSRKEDLSVSVSIYRINIVDGAMVRHKIRTLSIDAPCVKMTQEEFEEEMSDLLGGVGEKEASYIRNKSYDESHAYGFEAVLDKAKDILSELEEHGML